MKSKCIKMHFFNFSLPVAFALFFAGCGWFFQDPIIINRNIGNSCFLRVRAFREWEASVPIYLEVVRKKYKIKYKILESAAFYFTSPENLKTQNLELEIKKLNTSLVILYRKGNPNIILALVDLKDRFIYPPIGIKREAYFYKVEKILSDLKIILKNDKLELNT